MTDLNARLDTISADIDIAISSTVGAAAWEIYNAQQRLETTGPALVAALRAVLDLGAEVGHPLGIELHERIADALEES